MKRFLGLVLTLFAVVGMTTGCFKLQADLTVNADETISGSFTVSEAPSLTQQQIAEALSFASYEYRTEPNRVTFDRVPFDQFVTDKFGSLKIARVGDDIVFDGVIDPSKYVAAANLPGSEIRVNLAIPGTIKDTNGTESDQGLTWSSKDGKLLTMHAETWAPLAKSGDLLPVAAAVAAGIFFLAFMLGRPKSKKLKSISYE